MAKLSKSYVSALDIGSSKIVCFIAEITSEGDINILGVGHQLSQGIKSGTITDVKLAEHSISSAVGIAEEIAGVTVDRVIVNVSGSKQASYNIKAELNIKGNEIADRDIARIISHGCEENQLAGREIIHCIPVDYTIDGTAGIKNPQGMYCNSLLATLHIITANASNLINLTNCLAQCHLNIDGYISSAYASGYACLTEDEKELGATALDFGGSNVAISVFKGGNVVYTDSVPFGGASITNDLAIGLSTNIETAERIKNLYGNVFASSRDEQEIIDIPQITDGGISSTSHIPKSAITGIIKPRAEEILELVKRSLEKLGMHNIGGHIVVTGGGSQLGGILELTSQMLGRPVRAGLPHAIESMAESTKGAAFSTCTGLLMLAAKQRRNKSVKVKSKSGNNMLGKAMNWLKENF